MNATLPLLAATMLLQSAAPDLSQYVAKARAFDEQSQQERARIAAIDQQLADSGARTEFAGSHKAFALAHAWETNGNACLWTGFVNDPTGVDPNDIGARLLFSGCGGALDFGVRLTRGQQDDLLAARKLAEDRACAFARAAAAAERLVNIARLHSGFENVEASSAEIRSEQQPAAKPAPASPESARPKYIDQ